MPSATPAAPRSTSAGVVTTPAPSSRSSMTASASRAATTVGPTPTASSVCTNEPTRSAPDSTSCPNPDEAPACVASSLLSRSSMLDIGVVQNGAVRLVLADDHRMLRESLRRSLEGEGFAVVGEAADGAAAVQLAEALMPDVVLMDVSMPVLDGVEATRQVRRVAPGVQVVILTMHADQEVLVRAVRAGASGYLVKDCSTDEVVHTIRQAAAGETTISPDLATAMLAEAQHVTGQPAQGVGAPDEAVISKREEEVLQLIAEGFSTTEVAANLFISVKTVKNHLASVYQKLDSRDRTQAVLRAVRMGIIRLD